MLRFADGQGILLPIHSALQLLLPGDRLSTFLSHVILQESKKYFVFRAH